MDAELAAAEAVTAQAPGHEEVAMGVATAIDDVVAGPVLVVGSPPPGGRDLDLLATRDDHIAITQWLEAAGFMPWRHTWARFGAPGGYAVELTSTDRWRTRWQDASSLFIDAEPIPGFRNLATPGPATVLLLAARGTVTRRGRITDKVRRRVFSALERDFGAWSVAEEHGQALGMVGALRLLREAYESAAGLAPRHRAAGMVNVLLGAGPVEAKTRLLVDARPKRVRPAIVSFSGIDGSGKSTQVSKLKEHLAELGVSSDWQWAGFKSARRVRRLTPFLDRPRYEADGVTPRPRDPIVPSALVDNTLGQHAWVFIVVGVNALHLWRLTLPRRPGTTVLLFDRFTPDTTVKVDLHFMRTRGIDTRWQRRLFTLISPKPDVGFLVDVPIDIAYGRRQEQTPEELRNMAELYAEQVRRFGLIRLDGTDAPDELAKRVAVAAWQGLR